MRKFVRVLVFAAVAMGASLIGRNFINARSASPPVKLETPVVTVKDSSKCKLCGAENSQDESDGSMGWEDDGVDYAAKAKRDKQRVPSVLAAIKQKTKWLPPTAQAQREIFDYLKEKSGQAPSMPTYPPNALFNWSKKRYGSLPKEAADRKPVYALVYEDLLIAQKLLQNKALQRRRQGLLMVDTVNLMIVHSKLNDKWLYARIYEAFLLPNLSVGDYESWQNLSWNGIVSSARGAFMGTDEVDKQISVLELYLVVADPDNDNAVEWAHGQIAIALAKQKKYAEAIKHLKLVKSSGLGAMRALIPEYQKLLEAEEKAKTTPNSSEKEKNHVPSAK